MGKVLKEYPSKSSARIYHIVEGANGDTYCDCWQWRINRTCKHLEDYHGHKLDSPMGPVFKIVKNPTKVDLLIDSAIDYLK